MEEQLDFLLELAHATQEQSGFTDMDDECLPVSSLCLQWSPNECDLFTQFPEEGLNGLDVQLFGGFTVQFCDSVLQYFLDLEAHQVRFVTGLELLAGFLVLHGGSIPF